MSSVTIVKDTPQTAAVSRNRIFSSHSSTATGSSAPAAIHPTPSEPVRSLAGLAYPDSVRVRFADGYQTVPLYVASYTDGVRVVWCEVAGEMARITDYGRAGYAIEIKASDTPSGYHTVSAAEGCDCRQYAQHGACPHCGAARLAEVVYTTWQYAERVRSVNARRAGKGIAGLGQYQWEGVA